MNQAKMSKQDKVQAYSMRLDSASLQEIADKFGVTREYIRQIIPATGERVKQRSRVRDCIYPNIDLWMWKNRYTYTRIEKEVGFGNGAARRALTGTVVPNKDTIDKILKLTGMKYEVAFVIDEKEDAP